MSFEEALSVSLKKLKYTALKPEQEACIKKLVIDRADVFAVLPTGYGKSLIYQILPFVFTELNRLQCEQHNENNVVIVVSPLEYIRSQQVENLKRMGVRAESLGPTFSDVAGAQIIYGSAEQWLSETWVKNLKNGDLGNVRVLVVDEVHTVEMWGTSRKGQAAFREAFSRVAELRSFLPVGTPALALTATADEDMRKRLVKFIGFNKDHCRVIVSPSKNNIRFTVVKGDKHLECLNWLVEMIKEEEEYTPFTLIFCQVVSDIVYIMSYLLMQLGSSGFYAGGQSPDQQSCLIGIYYSQTPQSLKDNVTKSFEEGGCTRVAIASSSLSMGVDFPNVKYVIHFGPSKTLTGQLQEAGRAGRDSSDAFNIIIYLPKHLKNCDKQVKQAIKAGEQGCVRKALLSCFDEGIQPNEPLHTCCNTCHMQCKCQGDMCNVPLFKFDVPPTKDNSQITDVVRSASEDDKECLKNALDELRATLELQSPSAVLNCYSSYLFGLDSNTIQTIVENADNISGIMDLRKYCPFSSLKLLIMILEIMGEVFDDIEISDDLHQSVLETESLMNKLIENLHEDCESLPDDHCLTSLDEMFHLSEEWL